MYILDKYILILKIILMFFTSYFILDLEKRFGEKINEKNKSSTLKRIIQS